MLITCPSGLAGNIRGLKGLEAQKLSSGKLIRDGKSIDMMLQNCWLDTTETGPYPFLKVGGRPDWTKILLGDRFAALVDIRIASWGPEYDFDTQCKNPRCGEKYGWELNLADLPRKLLSEESKEKIRAGQNAFEATLPGHPTFTFKLATGLEEALVGKVRRANSGDLGIIDMLALQTISIEGIKKNDAAHREILGDLSAREIFDLLEEYQVPDCGVETKIETECTFCGWQQELQLPFGETFFFPKRRKPTATTKTEEETTDPPAPTVTGSP